MICPGRGIPPAPRKTPTYAHLPQWVGEKFAIKSATVTWRIKPAAAVRPSPFRWNVRYVAQWDQDRLSAPKATHHGELRIRQGESSVKQAEVVVRLRYLLAKSV